MYEVRPGEGGGEAMNIEANPKEAVSMGAWWLNAVASDLMVFAWVTDNFKNEAVQRVVDYSGEKTTDSCNDYYELVNKVRELANGIYIDSSRMHHDSVGRIAQFIELKADNDKATMAAIKREKIEKLKKELSELEAAALDKSEGGV